MSLFNFNENEILTFFMVLIRFGVLIAVLPITGDRFVPAPAKVLFALAVSIMLFPVLVKTGQIVPAQANQWASTAGGIVGCAALETVFALSLGFTAKLLFDAIHFGANLAGNFMGFASASTYDPHQESQTQIVAELQLAFAMLIFLAMDGHHLMLRSALQSYQIVGLGKVGLNAAFSQRLVDLCGQVLVFGTQMAAPIAVSLFAVNVAFGVMAKAMPQMNVLILSLSVSAFVGMIVMFISIPQFQAAVGGILGRIGEWMDSMMNAMRT